MGKRKLIIGLRENLSERKVTFNKRRDGLIKKLSELATICGISAGIVIFSANGEPTLYSSGNSFEDIPELLAKTEETRRSLWTGPDYPKEERVSRKKKREIERDQVTSVEDQLPENPSGFGSYVDPNPPGAPVHAPQGSPDVYSTAPIPSSGQLANGPVDDVPWDSLPSIYDVPVLHYIQENLSSRQNFTDAGP